MKRINITCPVCGSKAYLRPASVVYGDKAPDPDAKYYVCGRYPACDCYVAAHRKTMLRRSIKTNETVDGMGHDDLYQEGCIALCRAAVSYREEMGSFPAYAKVVIRNHLLDRCREIQSARKNLPLVSLDAFTEMGAPEPVSPFHTEDLISDVSSSVLLSHFKNRYHGTARLGIEAMELRVRGYSCADIAKLYQKKPNYIGACISRAAEKLRRERIVREFYTACTEQDLKSA